jgi:S-adenosylmethionine hydrolase
MPGFLLSKIKVAHWELMNMKAEPEFVALFTDFGVGSHYIGQVKSRLYAEGVTQPIIDLCADAPAFDSFASAYLLASFIEYLPRHTAVIAVVDPGVGSDRRALLSRCDDHWLLGPDNGLLSLTISRAKKVLIQTIHLEIRAQSNTFHGRDLFAPATAFLCNGASVPGEVVDRASVVGADWPTSLYQIVYIDNYGNAVSGIFGDAVSTDMRLKIHDVEIHYAQTFSAVKQGSCFWYVNANNLVEVAVNCGMASRQMNLTVGSEIELIQ